MIGLIIQWQLDENNFTNNKIKAVSYSISRRENGFIKFVYGEIMKTISTSSLFKIVIHFKNLTAIQINNRIGVIDTMGWPLL